LIVQDNSGIPKHNFSSSSADQIEELQQLYDYAPCGYHSLDENGVFIKINQTGLTMLGYNKAELIGRRSFFDLLTPASREIFELNFPVFKKRGWISDLELQLVRQDGSILPVSLSSQVIKDESGKYLYSRSVMIDITARKHLETENRLKEAEIRNSETLYRLLFESNPNPMWIYDSATLAFLEVNQAAIDHYGYSAAEFLQMAIADIQANSDPDALLTANQNLVPGTPHVGVWHHTKKDGSIIDVEVMAHAFLLAGRQANLVQIEDITELNQLAAQHERVATDLNKAQQRIVATWESMTDAFVSLDLDWRFTYVNQAAINVIAHLTDVQTTEILGKTHWEIFPELMGGIVEEQYRKAIAQQTPKHFEVLYEQTGNWFEIHVYPSAIGLSVYFQDISGRKTAEKKISEQANLLAIATDAIYVHDLDNQVLFWNQGAERLYECPAEEIMGQDWRQILNPSEPLPSPTDAWQGEVSKLTQGGREVIVMSRRSIMRDDTGKIKSILTVDTDITEKKKLESQFLRAQRLESLGMLASGIAHDLNNVLTPIIGIVQLLPLKITNLDPQIQRLLQILEESAHRGANLVKQILSFTRGIEGKPSNVQVGHLIAETQKIIQETFPKNIDLLINLPTDLWLTSADATLLHQVFLNLCVNARDAMPNGGQLEIMAENIEIDDHYAQMNMEATPGAYVAVTISDTGTGIPPEVIDRIFDPFFTTKDIGKGTGLGLSTVIGVVKSHQGFISVYSEINKGTKFKVYLPATEDSILDEEISNSPLFGQGELILVVDDELSVQEVTKATLEAHGYQTISASDGIEAIALYAERKSQIRVVLLDLMMPLLDSVTITRTLRKLNPEVQIIAMSGLSTNESVTKVMNEGVQTFIAKPFTAQEILLPLSQICKIHSGLDSTTI
jgi:PAS domain S-box-containing protein